MDKIQIKILNPEVIKESEKMMVAMARLTQRGHAIKDMKDFEELLDMPYTDELVHSMAMLPHPTIQKFGVINIAIIGASRRFLAQITRHQNEVKFMSGSLQYSDYSYKTQFVVPYEMIRAGEDVTEKYLHDCLADVAEYSALVEEIGRDAAGYKMPQGMRNVLVISATPYQLKHMIRQRTCNRNTMETQYVMLLIAEALYHQSLMFSQCLAPCTTGHCAEGKMRCKEPGYTCFDTATSILDERFPLIRG